MSDSKSLEEGKPPETAKTEEAAITSAAGGGNSSGKRQLLVVLLGTAALIGLAVGLSAGLTNNDDKKSRSSRSEPFLSETFLPVISASTIQQRYGSCESLSTDLVEASRLVANSAIESNVQWKFYDTYGGYRPGRGGGDVFFDEGVVARTETAADAADSDAGGSAAGPGDPVTEDSYGTNNQVEGVDEADIVKSDGEYVYAAYGREIVKIDADNVTISSRTELPTTSSECLDHISSMLLVDNTLVVIATGYCDVDYSRIVRGQGNTQVLVYDTADMSLLYEKPLQGSYISARSIGENIHIVTSSWLSTYDTFTSFLDPYAEAFDSDISEDEYRVQALVEAEKRAVSFVDQLARELDCTDMKQLALFQNSNVTLDFGGVLESMSTVYSFSVTSLSDDMSSTSMILPSSGWQVYSSQERLVLASEGWWIGTTEGLSGDATVLQETYLITYLLEDASATAMSLGTVPGYVLNQFSIDHAKQDGTDYLRVATSMRQQWTFDRSWSSTSEETSSQVTILEINDGGNATRMPVVGQLNNLGKPGERIYSVRFQGDRGFVVTFRETDPFYTLDLSVPTSPIAVGELEIPGFSNYLHPIGDDLILGVGQSVDPETGRTLGLQISLFDVSDFSKPSRVQNFVEDDGDYSSSEAQYDHRAFRYLEDSQLLILPLTIQHWDRNIDGDSAGDGFDGFTVYHIDKSAGIGRYFSIEHGSKNFFDGCWSYDGYLQARSLVFDGDIMTLKGHSILSHDLTTSLSDAPAINLDDGLEECSPYYFEDF